MSSASRILFGFRADLDQRWWHRLAKVAYVLGLIAFWLWGAGLPVSFPNDDDHVDNIRIVETLVDFTKAHPEYNDPVESFAREYGYRSGKREADGTVSLVFFEAEIYCSVNPYDHLYAITQYIRPNSIGGRRPTEADAQALLERLNIAERDPLGYSCISFDDRLPSPTEIVGWEYTRRAKLIGYAQHYGLLALVCGILSLIVLNLYYRGFVYIVCGPRRTA
jgi:hypothetical protein